MGKGLSLDIGMNTREVVKGSADIEKALDDVGDTLDELARDGDRNADKLDRAFTGALRDIQTESKRAGDAVGRNIDHGTSRAKESMRELKTEGLANAAEVFSSTDGSIQGFADGIQGTLGGVVAGLAGVSPAAAAAAGGAAVAFGLVTSELARQEEATKRLRQRFADLYKSASDDGRAYLSEAQIQAEVLDILWNPDRVNEYRDAQKAVKDTGLDLTTVLRGLAGDQQAAADIVAVTGARVDELSQKIAGYQGAVQGGSNPVLNKLLGEQGALEGIRDRYQDVIDVQKTGTETATLAQQLLSDMRKAERDQIQATSDADQARWEALAANVDKARKLQVVVPVAVKPPPAADVIKSMQRELDRSPTLRVKVGLKAYGRDVD